jgi:cytochrome c oxidase cbb3-type subunit 3
MAIFYLTIGFSIIYGAYFFWLDVGDHQDAKYTRKSELHDAKFQIKSESPGEMGILTDAADLEEGATIYRNMNCFTCHGMNLEGNAIGPNLTDNFAIHGCDFQSTFNIIKNGVPAKGMTPFKAQLSDSRIQKVSSYILSMMGSTPDNAKEPQGEACE